MRYSLPKHKLSGTDWTLPKNQSKRDNEDNLQLYLYLGKTTFKGHSFPLFFIPCEVEEIFTNNKKSMDLRFEKRFVINKQALEFIYQEEGNTQFYMDAREGFVYIVDTEEKVIEPEPEKKWSLYGEE